jgi:hypothetical protein
MHKDLGIQKTLNARFAFRYIDIRIIDLVMNFRSDKNFYGLFLPKIKDYIFYC